MFPLQGKPRPESLASLSSAQTGTLRGWVLAALTRSFLTSSVEPLPPESSLQTLSNRWVSSPLFVSILPSLIHLFLHTPPLLYCLAASQILILEDFLYGEDVSKDSFNQSLSLQSLIHHQLLSESLAVYLKAHCV